MITLSSSIRLVHGVGEGGGGGGTCLICGLSCW